MITNYTKNIKGRDFVVGDIHGEYIKLMNILDSVNFDKKVDRLFAVGDLIDRGPNSADVLSLLSQPWFNSVMGNHEQMFINSTDSNGSFLENKGLMWVRNGGEWFLDVDSSHIRKSLRSSVLNLPTVLTIDTDSGKYGVTHADCLFGDWNHLRGETNKYNVQQMLLWSRVTITDYLLAMDRGEEHEIDNVENITAVIHGHTPITSGFVKVANRYFIDTGACQTKGHFTLLQVQPTIKVVTL